MQEVPAGFFDLSVLVWILPFLVIAGLFLIVLVMQRRR